MNLKEINIEANANFISLSYNEEEDCWCFLFDQISVTVKAEWYLMQSKKLIFNSYPPFDEDLFPNTNSMTEMILKHLVNKKLKGIKTFIDGNILILTISDNVSIEIRVNPRLYDRYEIRYNNKVYLGFGSEEIVVLEFVRKPIIKQL